jgi:hypothetical protein
MILLPLGLALALGTTPAARADPPPAAAQSPGPWDLAPAGGAPDKTVGGAATKAPGCVPGAQVQCACPGGALGVQVCAATGDHLGPCDCAPARVVATDPRPMERRNPGAYTAGLTLTVIGGIAFIVGSTWLVALYTSNDDGSCTNADTSTAKCVVAGGVGVLGAAGLVIGIPMMVGAGAMVPASSHDKTAAPSWVPTTVAVSRTGAQLRWTF